MEYGSIHSFLGLRLNEREDGSQECRQESDPTTHKYSLVIVDECSMLGADLFERISISKRNALVLFVGDPAQLPPVGDLDEVSQVFARVTYRVTLTEIVRQAESNPIIRLSIAIRKAMERNEKVSLMTLGEALPVAFPAKAGIMQGGTAAALSALLYEIEQGRDARILAFTNNAVLAYNAGAHRALHGATVHPFVAGERAIAHQPFDAQSLDKDNEPAGLTMVINSEELLIESITAGTHYIYRDQYPCCRVVLKRDSGERVACWIANDRDQVDRDICALFSEWRKLKLAAQAAERRGDRDADKLRRDAAEMSGKAWALRKTFAPLRHAYAMTTHKSQGSTFDTAIVDFNDMNRMRSPMQFNRGLYVAITRPREHLAIIV
jgi:exodeoxyribonuclease-5